MTAMAVQDALSEACNLTTDIKWPNDILAGEKKLCGILAETVETPAGRAVIVGIGINLNRHSFAPELESTATSVEAVSGTKPNVELVLESWLTLLPLGINRLERGTELFRCFASGARDRLTAREKRFE